MFTIVCPYCGVRDGEEFTYVGDAKAKRERPAMDAPIDAFQSFVYERSNPRGPHWELWQHTAGCRGFVEVQRDTVTHKVYACRSIAEAKAAGEDSVAEGAS